MSLAREIGKRGPFDCPEQEAMLNLLRTAAVLAEPIDCIFRSADLSAPAYNILRILRGHGEPLPCGSIAAEMIARVPDMTRLVDRLEKKELVARLRCAEDRRVVPIAITAKGKRLLKKLDPLVLAEHRRSMARLSRQELNTLSRLLTKARDTDRAPGKSSPRHYVLDL